MAIQYILLPSLGEGITDATILKWLKQPGDLVQEEEVILEIATDKVDSEVPAPATGILKETFFSENQIAPVGSVIATIETEQSAENQEVKPTETIIESAPKDEITENVDIPYLPQTNDFSKSEGSISNGNNDQPNNGFYSPLVLNIAKTEGISYPELEKIAGTGKDNRVSKNDLLAYVAAKKSNNLPAMDPKIIQQQAATVQEVRKFENSTPSNNVEIVEMDRMRKLIAHHMKESQNTSATVTSFEEADVTKIVQWRNKVKANFEKQENTKITFTPIFMDCVIKALKKYPMLNSSVDGDNIILKKDINLGMATALPSGNLIVPVIKNASYLNLAGLSRAVNDLADNARKNKLKPSDTQDGTFTITNVGSFGSLTGTPIINQPQVAILAIGTIKKKPVVIESETGDTIGIRHIMMLSLSYDHRIIDGALGSTFLHEIVKEMENWDSAQAY